MTKKNLCILIVIIAVIVLICAYPFRHYIWLNSYHMTFIQNLKVRNYIGEGEYPWILEHKADGTFEDLDGNVYNLYITKDGYHDDYYKKYFQSRIQNKLNEIVQNSDMNVYPKEYKSGETMISYKLTNEWIPSVMPFNVFMQYHLITVFPIVELPPDADMQETIDQLTELAKTLTDEGFYFKIETHYRDRMGYLRYEKYEANDKKWHLQDEVRNCVQSMYLRSITHEIEQKIMENTDFSKTNYSIHYVAEKKIHNIILEEYGDTFPECMDEIVVKEITPDQILINVGKMTVALDADGKLIGIEAYSD